MSPGDISALSLSDEVAFRVRFSGAVPAHRDRYWRALVLHRFSGRTWTGRETMIGFRPDETVEYRGQALRYGITMEATRQHWIPALELPATWTLADTYMQPTLALSRITPVDQRISYEVLSYPEHIAEPRLRPYFRGWFLDLPAGTNPRAQRFGTLLRQGAQTDAQYITRVLAHFNEEEFVYTTEPPALGSNPVDRFLFDTRRGFCEHYASAFTVLMRVAGIPARVVLGYQGGELNPMGDYMIVRQSDAHAWSEVWLEGRGWLRVDPTAAVAPERIELGRADSRFGDGTDGWGFDLPTRVLHELKLSWDALNAFWNDRVLGYGPDRQKDFMRRLGMDEPQWRDMFLALIAAVVVLTLAISAVMMWRYRPPPPDRAKLLYSRFIRATGLGARVGESPAAFAARAAGASALSPATIDEVTVLYQAARYGGRPEATADLEAAVRALRRRPAAASGSGRRGRPDARQ
jgi:transglutaminase-like putative cysteine protease